MNKESYKLWYKKEATEWTEALPLGNGHMGAMVYGDSKGRFDLSEATCWSGKVQDETVDQLATQYMQEARTLLIQNQVEEAEQLLNKCLGIKENYGTQLPLGRLWVGLKDTAACTYRQLDLRGGVCEEYLSDQDTEIKRTSFIAAQDKVMGIRMVVDKGMLPESTIWIEGYSTPTQTTCEDDQLIVIGRAFETLHSDGQSGVSYKMQLRVVTDGIVESSEIGLSVKNATEIIVFVTAVTDMFYSNLEQMCNERLDQAIQKGWDQVLESHYTEHSKWMDKCTLELDTNTYSDLPTNERILKYKEDPTDQALIALFFEYGRYMLLNASRPDSLLPAALQGIWNDNRACKMEWTDDMHLDINTQMNYFPAEVTGLGPCCRPLFDWVENRLMPEGYKMAEKLYSAEGWCAHTVSNAWGWAAPGWGVGWAYHVSGGAWVATHLWEHYLYHKDVKFLSDKYPILRDAAQFLYDLLMEDKESGYLVTVPSYSPENMYYHESGKAHAMTVGATVDTVITKYLFNCVLEANAILKQEDPLVEKIKEALAKMKPFEIGKHGELLEWYKPFEEVLPDHRHTSHLMATYPFNMIDKDETPELAEAVKVSLQRRLGDNASDIVLANWAGAFLILYYARLGQCEEAGEAIRPMMTFLSRPNMMITHEGPTSSITGGIYELDGNTGFTAGVAEMLIQSHTKEIRVLPTLPRYLENGKVSGLVARGGHQLDLEWHNNILTKVSITAGSSEEITIRYKEQQWIEHYETGETKVFYYNA